MGHNQTRQIIVQYWVLAVLLIVLENRPRSRCGGVKEGVKCQTNEETHTCLYVQMAQPLNQMNRYVFNESLPILICLFFVASNVYAEGEVEGLKDFQYWDNGKVKQCTMYDADGRLTAKAFCRYDGTTEKVEKYDTYGNEVLEALYDEAGKLKTGIDGWAAMRWWYDGSQLISQISYDEDGKPIERKQYSESGKLILRQYIDDGSDLAPYEAASMAMMLGGHNLRYDAAQGEK